MIKFLKTTMWWMFIPFACFSYPMTQWVFKVNDEKTRFNRLVFILLNTIVTSILSSIIILKYFILNQ